MMYIVKQCFACHEIVFGDAENEEYLYILYCSLAMSFYRCIMIFLVFNHYVSLLVFLKSIGKRPIQFLLETYYQLSLCLYNK